MASATAPFSARIWSSRRARAPHAAPRVFSVPRGVLVQLDGQPADVTPARLDGRRRTHSVALLLGEARLLEREVKVPAGGVASV